MEHRNWFFDSDHIVRHDIREINTTSFHNWLKQGWKSRFVLIKSCKFDSFLVETGIFWVKWINGISPGLVIIHHHDDVIKRKHFPRYRPFVWGNHWSPVNSSHKGQRRRALMLFLICVWTNGWVNNRDAGDLRRHCSGIDNAGWTSPCLLRGWLLLICATLISRDCVNGMNINLCF